MSMVDIYSKKKRSWLMSRVKSKGSVIEVKMAKGFQGAGLHFESHCGDVFGRPDFVFRREHIAVFCDSEFWHGYRMGPRSLSKYSPFWRKKIAYNKRRDRLVNRQLAKLGWTVVRFWGKDIMRNQQACVAEVVSLVNRVQLCVPHDRV